MWRERDMTRVVSHPSLRRPTTPVRSRENAFDLLRLLAAFLVLAEHSWVLSGHARPLPLQSGTELGSIGVGVFFLTSGYLICGSWLADPSVRRFGIRRALRIYPLYALVIVGSVLVLGPLLTTLSVRDYLSTASTWSYLQNLVVLTPIQPDLPGVFETNPQQGSVNGSLWTIPIEVMCYVAVAVLGAIGVLRSTKLLVVLAVAAIGVSVAIDTGMYTSGPIPVMYGAEPAAFFLLGMVARQTRWVPSWTVVTAAAAVWALLWGTPLASLGGLIMAGCATFALAFRLPAGLRHPTGRFDLSYGIYLLAFPVQQCLVQLGLLNAVANLAVTVVLVAPLAAVSWKVVEAPFLAFKPGAPRAASIPPPESVTVADGDDDGNDGAAAACRIGASPAP